MHLMISCMDYSVSLARVDFRACRSLANTTKKRKPGKSRIGSFDCIAVSGLYFVFQHMNDFFQTSRIFLNLVVIVA
ncbi:hypothetical protein PAECIP111802_03590 [Paenibacillus allorhizosphaerae]|uniref:Uncharacterized protein n=1 Tax=Paenibacillus allorhizosphaerae TaxID=2849866 RepID=A0ABM8VJU2_9BACL|nr:hypothetical protein PAECIP111802_03590 [Paenibacillus allorhizosphaerae]